MFKFTKFVIICYISIRLNFKKLNNIKIRINIIKNLEKLIYFCMNLKFLDDKYECRFFIFFFFLYIYIYNKLE